ncbi:MAG TPA: hypothetical protein VFC21_01675 [Bryobacteraceae bacterium]|nr:hypothetical protein [Bryobacteraceae bacterium]
MRNLLWSFALPALLSAAQSIPLDDLSRLDMHGVNAASIQYHGAKALRLTEKAGNQSDSFAILRNVSFHNGTIDVDVAGAPGKGAAESARGFIGIAFRIADNGSRFECFYVRPTNARADDQLRRNHTTQYISFPGWPWDRLRSESPGVYESYADMVAGEWVHLRIVVSGTGASLYVGGATQPSLLVHDLKLGDTTGGLALWTGPGTEGCFKSLTMRP